MSKRPILSRPRTRVYDSNYSMGESLYKSTLDRLDRKYSGRPLSPPPRNAPSLPKDIQDRHEKAFLEDDLENCRRRAEKSIQAESFFDSRGARVDARDLLDNFDEETVTRIKSIRASKKVSAIDDIGMESTVNNLTAKRFFERSDKILDSIGLGRGLDEDVTLKRRSLRFAPEEEGGSKAVSKWTAIKDEQAERAEIGTSIRAKQIKARMSEVEEQDKIESAASVRAKQSRARLSDLEDEMEAMAERQAIREKKAARLRALIQEVADENDIPAPVSTRRAIRVRQTEEEVAY